jgi:hypothetical protein
MPANGIAELPHENVEKMAKSPLKSAHAELIGLGPNRWVTWTSRDGCNRFERAGVFHQ